MWILFGLLVIIITVISMLLNARVRENKHAMVLALLLMALSIWAQYPLIAKFMAESNISGILDVVPTISVTLLRQVIILIFLNALPILLELKRK